ncbi:MAG: hypothetical protein V4564_05235 [Pseudomonadota bacterium]|uniref:hypothetical protein n=1 Tax=Sphingomonas sp. ERG5 TaxID=1381597 RepID=UPI000ADC0662|nr:hypothetical protein [Sphingomonas sp. ERG5]
MFGLGKKKPPLQIFELVFFPDGDLIRSGWFDAIGDGPDWPREGKIERPFRVDGEPCKLDATARGGNAVFSLWHDDRIVTSSLFVSGADAETNAWLIESYLGSIRQTNLVRQLTSGQEAPFGTVADVRERPMLVTMLMPAASSELTDALLERQRGWVSGLAGA